MGRCIKQREEYFQRVLDLHDKGLGAAKISRIIPVPQTTIRNWIANFVAENGKTSPMIVMQKPQDQSLADNKTNEVQALQQRVKELEAQLLQAEIKAEFYDEMINVAEAKFKIPIRKKAGAKQ